MFQYTPIGILHTYFTEKFGTPRQSMMIAEAKGVLKLNPHPHFRHALKHLEKFSHIWIIFQFHQSIEKGWRPIIRPPRLDSHRKIGVFASRSPHRPNPIGLSAVKLDRIDFESSNGIEIHVSGVDILDKTPVLDIKPYLPFADRLEDATGGWAESEIPRFEVLFSDKSLEKIQKPNPKCEDLKKLITQILEWDPRPTSQRRAMSILDPASEGMRFGFRILDYDIQWEIRDQKIYVLDLVEYGKS